ncbi:ComF family protein [Gimesia benthica]|uniref:ComF family protein n=1 Tax=Gimesia benthica TaxID=2608982 RepID=A0A6I6ACT6_9PLAN|nr:ComF family protein [Gimesia benthica]QGQ24344.1 ComF family protein [Gimesia benthica]
MKYSGIPLIETLSRGWLQAGRNFVYPPRCVLCGEDQLCDGTNCGPRIDQIAPLMAHTCGRCGAPVGPHVETSSGCIHCRKDRFLFTRAIALGQYQGPLSELILKLKQNPGAPLGVSLGNLLYYRHQETLENMNFDLIIPIPLHWTSRLYRSHNPSTLIGEALSGRLQAPFDVNILAKRKRTPAQLGLNSSERRRNLRDAFRVRRARRIQGQSILLVDDVLTTGSTANAATQALLEAGAREINVAVIARALGQ